MRKKFQDLRSSSFHTFYLPLCTAHFDCSEISSREWFLNGISYMLLCFLAIWSWDLQREQVLASSSEVCSMGQCYCVIKKQWALFSCSEGSAKSFWRKILPGAVLLWEPQTHASMERSESRALGWAEAVRPPADDIQPGIQLLVATCLCTLVALSFPFLDKDPSPNTYWAENWGWGYSKTR